MSTSGPTKPCARSMARAAANQLKPASTHAAPVVHVLHPGDVALGGRGDRLETLLGSCVSILLTDPRRTVGVGCHIVHPGPPPAQRPHDTAYAQVAWAAMTGLLRARGISPQLCEAYVYGGGHMFPSQWTTDDVGAGNCAHALRLLQSHGMAVLHQDLGGHWYRRLSWTVGPNPPTVTPVAVDSGH